MLHGQELSVTQVFLIAIVGMSVVLIELGLLSFCISILSKLIASKKPDAPAAPKPAAAQPAPAAPAPAPAPAPVAAVAAPMAAALPQGMQVTPIGHAGGSDEEIAAAMAAIFAASGGR